FLAKNRKVAIIAIFVLAAILTPSIDAFTQILLAGALLILYELSIWLTRMAAVQRDEGKVIQKLE
ncbi:twin-arginine translocase subunit TatC, partial [bacterium]|nr:twin-arginine translocase subunit TatC [bacterium]